MMSKPISENVSKKRGRPRLVSPENTGAQMIRALFRDTNKTERGIQNKYYFSEACRTIQDRKDCKWLWDKTTGVVRTTIIQELGRIPDEDLRLTVAKKICKIKPTARDAVLMIRRVRRGLPEGNPLALANEIIRTINDYWKRFPKTTIEQTMDALHTATAQANKLHRET